MLIENECVVNDAEKVSNIFNEYFTKATGYEGLPARILKLCVVVLWHSIAGIVNGMIDHRQSDFPQILKNAELALVFKKLDQLNKCNYRPVSVLTICSKMFEADMFDQANMKLLSKYRSMCL